MQNRRIVFQHAAANIAIRFFYRHFAGGAEDLFQRRNRQRGAVNQLLRQFAGVIHQFRLANHAVDYPPTQRLFCAHSSAGHHHFIDDGRRQDLR